MISNFFIIFIGFALHATWMLDIVKSDSDIELKLSEMIRSRFLQTDDPCVGNFTFDFSKPQLSHLPPVDAQCKTIFGSLHLTSCYRASDCSLPQELKLVESVLDTLSIHNIATIPDNRFTHIGYLIVAYSPLTSLEPLSRVKAIPNGITLAISAIQSLKGLENVEETYELIISFCAISQSTPMQLRRVHDISFSIIPLVDFNGFKNLERVDNFYIGMTGLKSLDGLSSLSRVQSLIVNQNLALESVILSKLNQAAFIAIGQNPKLNSVSFPNLENPSILAIEGSRNLEKMENLGTFDNGESLILLGHVNGPKDLEGFKKSTNLFGISLYNISSLESLDGLDNVRNISYIALNSLPSLTSLMPLSNIEAIGEFAIDDIPLVEYSDLESLEYASRISFSNTPNFKSFRGLSKLRILDVFAIKGPSAVKNFNEISNLTKLEQFYINGNGLYNLESIEIGTGNLGRPDVFILNHEKTKLKRNSTFNFLEKVCPKGSQITWNGCSNKNAPPLQGKSPKNKVISFSDLNIPSPLQVKANILSKISGVSR